MKKSKYLLPTGLKRFPTKINFFCVQFEALSVKKVQNITLLNLEYCYCKESFCNWFSSPKPLVHSKKIKPSK